ncbi:MAG: transglycosylase SLT domain-containing protein [Anaerolineae bacterium]|nr:transglycosylase SLT domain-containing protein [Anaerolineae bacterium]
MLGTVQRAVVVIPLAVLLVFAAAPADHSVYASPRSATEVESLSPYWSSRVLRWESLIVQEAHRRQLDPDLVASLVWKESRGDAKAVGPVGSVGLMQIMPKEEGFHWRPSRDELLNPYTNVYWGTRTLSTVIHQGDGDVFSALAAYNGGWEKVSSRVPKAFAATILHDYARAVAVRLGVEDDWVAFIAIEDTTLHGPIWVTRSDDAAVTLYGEENLTPEGEMLIPPVAPTAELAACVDSETGQAYTVGIYLFRPDARKWVTEGEAPPVTEPVLRAVLTSPALMAGSLRPETPGLTGATPTAAPALPSTPRPSPTAAPGCADATATPSVEAAACAGGPLLLDAYPLERYHTVDGWAARVYASGRGGNCVYDYAWNTESDVQGAGYSGPIVFEVRSSRRGTVIVGTVVLVSGDELVRTGLYIMPPGD